MAQSVAFFTAGFETTSTTMTYSLYELALNPEVQEKLREEILRSMEKHDGCLTYDGIMEMNYLSMVVSGKTIIIVNSNECVSIGVFFFTL